MSMYMMKSGRYLVETTGNETSCKWSPFSRLCQLVQVSLHALKDKVQFARFGGNEGVVQGDDGVVLRNARERLGRQ